MQNEYEWRSYQEVVTQAARSVLKPWMVGIELNDIKNELWVKFFELMNAQPDLPKPEVIRRIKSFAKNYKRDEHERVFGRSTAGCEVLLQQQISETGKSWELIQELWNRFVLEQTKEDQCLLNLLVQAISAEEIAAQLNIARKTVFNRKNALLDSFGRRIREQLRTGKA